MKTDSLYKVHAGCFSMLDAAGNPTDNYKSYALFRNTYGLVFLIYGSAKDRCHAIYFARDLKNHWNFRTVFPVGRLIETDSSVTLKTRYNQYVWEQSSEYSETDLIELKQWIKENGSTYIPSLLRYDGVREYLGI